MRAISWKIELILVSLLILISAGACTSKIAVTGSAVQQGQGITTSETGTPRPDGSPIAESPEPSGDPTPAPSESAEPHPVASPTPELSPSPMVSNTPTPTPTPTPVIQNTVPQFSFTAPVSAMTVPLVGTYLIAFTASDPDDNAAISLYVKTSSTSCEPSLTGWTSIASGLRENTQTSYLWTTTSVTPGTYFICARISDGINPDVFVVSSGTVKVNAPPTVTSVSPLASTVVPQVGSVSLTYTPADPDDNGAVSLYYGSAATNCDSSLTGWTLVATGLAENSVNSYFWTTNAIPAGTYYICARISDAVNPDVFSLSASTLKINAVPTFAWTVTTSTLRLIPATNFSLAFSAADADDAATINVYRRASNAGTCLTGGTLLAPSLVEGTDTAFTWDASVEANVGTGYLCAYVSDGINPAQSFFTPIQVFYRNCTWTGSVDSAWENAGNWSGCGTNYPNNYAKVLIPAAAGNQPVLASAIPVLGFFSGAGGGSITVGAGASLINSGHGQSFDMESDVIIKGDTLNCSTCRFRYSSSSGIVATVKNGAKLTIGNGLGISGASYFNVGNGLSHGHLETVADTGNPAEYPYFDATYNTFGFKVTGTASNRSTVKFSGLRAAASYSVNGVVVLESNYEVLAMDQVKVDPTYTSGPIVYAKDCSSGLFTDSNWTGWALNNGSLPSTTGTVKSDASCATFAAVTITGNGLFYGPFAEFTYDAGNIFSWTNGSQFTCTWTGASGTSFTDPTNWSGCANGRNGYPDYNDIAVITNIPSNQPTVSSTIALSNLNTGVALGSGGVLTIAAGANLSVDDLFGQVTFVGDSTTCSTCVVTSPPRALGVQTGAELILSSGIYIGGASVSFGTGSGRLRTDIASNDPNEWPHIGNRLIFGSSNFIYINGLRVSRTTNAGSLINFNGSGTYTINRFDNVIIDSNHTANDFDDAFITFGNIGLAVLNDTIWSGIDFVDGFAAGGKNILFTNLSGMVTPGVVSISPRTGGTNMGYGAAYTNDPVNFLNWQ